MANAVFTLQMLRLLLHAQLAQETLPFAARLRWDKTHESYHQRIREQENLKKKKNRFSSKPAGQREGLWFCEQASRPLNQSAPFILLKLLRLKCCIVGI